MFLLQREILVKSSDGNSAYVVQFLFDADKLSVFCDCSAGVFGKICKHKLALLTGDDSTVANADSVEAFREVQKWISQSMWPTLLSELQISEENARIAQSELARSKKKIEAAMKHGV